MRTQIILAATAAALALPAAAQQRDGRGAERLTERLEARGFSNVERETGGTRDYITADGPDGAIRVPVATEAERAARRDRRQDRRRDRLGE